MVANKVSEKHWPILTPRDDGSLEAFWHPRTFRFLLSDGRVVDIHAVRDDSNLRGAVLKHTKAEAIVGSVEITTKEPEAGGDSLGRSTE